MAGTDAFEASNVGPGRLPSAPLPPDTASYIGANLPLVPVPSRPDIRLHLATPSSGLSRQLGNAVPPYWAFCWSGGLALARYLADRPDCVSGLRVLDFGSGSGLVAIAAAKAGARSVLAAEIDPNGAVAIGMNAAANGVVVDILRTDLIAAPIPDVDLVLAGDTFYSASLARLATGFFDRCLDKGLRVLVGDPGRDHLPLDRLRELARYDVADFGFGGMSSTSAAVYEFG
ncbi:MAG: 50S ribosomal protein L11 methyltransferase [Mesorhizobium sp.]|nr:50S ribosomal protein L11 methyltransferase [Mesorhizobium sp.]